MPVYRPSRYQQLVIHIAKTQDLGALKRLRCDGEADINIRNQQDTPVSMITSESHVDKEAMSFLLEHGACIDQAVYGAAKAGHDDLVAELISQGASEHFATRGRIAGGRFNYDREMNLLISHPRNLIDAAFHADGENQELIMAATLASESLTPTEKATVFAVSGRHAELDALLAQHAPTIDLSKLMFYCGYYRLDESIVDYVNNKEEHQMLLIGSAISGDKNAVDRLVQPYHDLLPSAIKGMAKGGHRHLIEQYLTTAPDEEAKQLYLLFAFYGAVETANEALCLDLIEKGLNFKKALLFVIEQNDMILIKKIFQRFPQYLNEPIDNESHTALHIASQKGHTELTQFLISQGMALEARDNLGQTPMDLAQRQSAVKTLLKQELEIRLITLKLKKPALNDELKALFNAYKSMYGLGVSQRETLSDLQCQVFQYFTAIRQGLSQKGIPYELQLEIYECLTEQASKDLPLSHYPLFNELLANEFFPFKTSPEHFKRIGQFFKQQPKLDKLESETALEQFIYGK